MDDLRLFIELYGYPPEDTLDGQRQFKTFKTLLNLYGFEELKKQHTLESSVCDLSAQTHINTHHYSIKDVTDDVLIAHIEYIHKEWRLPIMNLVWWDKAIRKQASEMVRDYSQSDLHYYMHKLENDQWYKSNITEPFTFKMIRKYIARFQ
jgi:hypothetical protein